MAVSIFDACSSRIGNLLISFRNLWKRVGYTLCLQVFFCEHEICAICESIVNCHIFIITPDFILDDWTSYFERVLEIISILSGLHGEITNIDLKLQILRGFQRVDIFEPTLVLKRNLPNTPGITSR